MNRVIPSLCILLLAASVWADTHPAAGCSNTQVQTAIDLASDGDTVTVPAGNCQWTGSVTIPNDVSLVIQGAGIGDTTISRSGETLTFVVLGNASRITGFTFNEGQIAIGGDDAAGYDVDDWRIDHNRFIGAGNNGYVAVVVNCPGTSSPTGRFCRGLIDNNTFDNGAVAVPFVFGSAARLHEAWAAPTGLGSANFVFLEDNIYNTPAGQTYHVIDTNYAGRFVMRFNTITNGAFEVHSLQQWRASRAWEIYKNTLTETAGAWTTGLLRGGIGVFWGNTMSSGYDPLVLDNVRSYNTGYDYGNCDGTSTADSNTAENEGYVCRDQFGSGQDTCLSNPSNLTSTATGWCSQGHEPSYFFLNRTGGTITGIDTSGRGRSSTLHVIVNRDFYNETASFNGMAGVGVGASRPPTCVVGVAYWQTDEGEWNKAHAGPDGRLYKCTAMNTWTLVYTPYEYPHPLRNIPSAPTNIR